MSDSSVLVVDDHPLVRRACGMVFEEADAAVYSAGDVEEGYRCFAANRPDVVVADLTYRDGALSGLSLIARIRALVPEARILVFSMHDDPTIVARALAAGAIGYLLKDTTASDLLTAFHRVRAGTVSIDDRLTIALASLRTLQPCASLTRRERRILVLLARRRSCACVARDLGLDVGTLTDLCTGMSHKLDLADLADLIRFAVARREAVPPRSHLDARSLP